MNDSDFGERKISGEKIYDGKILHVVRDEIEQKSGRRAFREVIRHNGAACVVPINDNNEVICVKQFRYPFAKTLIEIPAGKLDSKEENPREAALRELREETGYSCKEFRYLGKVYPSPAILDEVIYMYMATGLVKGDTDFDEGEIIEPLTIPIEELVKMIMNDEISDSKTQAAVLKAYNILNGFDCNPKEN